MTEFGRVVGKPSGFTISALRAPSDFRLFDFRRAIHVGKAADGLWHEQWGENEKFDLLRLE